MKRLMIWYKSQTPLVQTMLVLIPLLILGIILQRHRILDGIGKGFNHFSK